MDLHDGLIVESSAAFRRGEDDCMSVYVPLASYGGANIDENEASADQMQYSWLGPASDGHQVQGGGIVVDDEDSPSSSQMTGSWSFVHDWGDGNPRTMLLIILCNSGQTFYETFGVKVSFDIPIFSCCCVAKTAPGKLQIGVITIDGYLHVVVVPYTRGDGYSPGHAIVSSVSVVDTVSHDFGKPVNMVMVRDVVCLGGDSGSVACYCVKDDKIGHGVSYLGLKSGILGNMASYLGFSNRQQQSFSKISCINSVSMSWNDCGMKSILFCLHEDATLCIWDVDNKVLLHSVVLLPHEDVNSMVPSCLDYSQDFLHDSGIFLIASFENLELKRSTVSLFEVTVDNRNDILSVHIENGPQLPEVDGRIKSASLEFMDANRYNLWFVTQNLLTRQYRTERVSFQGDSRGNHTTSYFLVKTLEMRLQDLLASSEEDEEMLKVYFSEIHSALQLGGGDHLGNYIVETIFLPWNYSQIAMTGTFAILDIKRDYFQEEIDENDVYRSFRNSVLIWMEDAGSPLESFAKITLFLKTYIREMGQVCCPISIKVIQNGGSRGKRLVTMMRGDGRISILSDATFAESLEYISKGNKDCPLTLFRTSMALYMSPAAVSMARYAINHGLGLKQTLIPLLLRVLTGGARVNAVEFGKHSQYVRMLWRKFPLMIKTLDIGEIETKLASLNSHYQSEIHWRKEPCPNIDMVAASIANSILYGCSTARVDILFQILVVLEYNMKYNYVPYSKNLIDAELPAFVSYWACTTSCIQDHGRNKLKPPSFSKNILPGIGHESKRMKLLQFEGKFQQVFDLCLKLNLTLAESDAEIFKDLTDIQLLSSSAVKQFLGNSSLVEDVLLALSRDKDILNRDELLESLLSLIESLDVVKGMSAKFFEAYLSSKKAMDIPGHMDAHSLLEQQGIRIFLSLCDSLDDSHNAESLLNCLESIGKTVSQPLTEEKYIDAVTSILDHLGCVSSMTRCSLFSARLQESLGNNDGFNNGARTRARVFKVLEDAGKVQEAYAVALSISDSQRQIDCLRGLVEHLCSYKDLETLCTLPMLGTISKSNINVLDEVIHALWDRAIKESIDESSTYSILFDFYVSRGNFQSAAAALLSYCRRLVKESSRQSLSILIDLQKNLVMVSGCLKLVNEGDAWLEDTSAINTQVRRAWSGSTILSKEYTLPQIVDGSDIERELILVKSLIQIVSIIPDYDIHNGPNNVLSELLELNLYQEAWDLVTTIFSASDLQKAKEKIVSRIAKECAVSNSPKYWNMLKLYITRERACLAAVDRLLITATDAILDTDPLVGIPPWMLEPYLCKYELLTSNSVPKNHLSDSTGMVRVLLKHHRVELAGQIALELLSPIVTSIPSLALARVGSVCIPHDLINQVILLLESMPQPSKQASLLLKRLQIAKKTLEQSSSSQTNVLENRLSV